jgi:hypothetical protein
MFGSDLLDIAIGMIFFYLLLSLICSATNEVIEGWLKNRATDLERGIRELLDPNSTVEQSSIVDELYKHPLVNGLYKGSYEDFAKHMRKFFLWRWLRRLFTRWPKLPSYIPARNFALALMDTVLPANPVDAASPLASPPTHLDRASGAAGATPPAAPAAPLVVVTPVEATTPLLSPPAPNPLQPLRDAISALPNEQTRRALLTIVDAAGNDVSKARENIEAWFNSSMDRVSGWYKQRAQIILLIIGFGLTVALNADSITVLKYLSTNKAVRDSMVAAAEAYAKENSSSDNSSSSTATAKPSSSPSPSPTPSPLPSPAVLPAARTTASPVASPSASPSASPAASPSASPAASPSASPAPTPTECAAPNENSPECKIAKNLQEIKKLGLPVGWVDPDDDPQVDVYRRWPGDNWTGKGGWTDQLYKHLLGWLITAMAVSLGAPFWFDLLNKFIVVRSTIKPHEKSPEEGSKE